MAENEEKVGFAKGLKSEFSKIIWPNKETLIKQSVAVTVISVVLGGVIAILDLVMQYAINLIIGI
ncbi:MAG: preprotein translocase subunit SecE [Lachnospiraceae bacterium]|nr:preprotein translocase subunit SecE [Lachnospiraceae bacterium]